jgi:hypothetical protein
MLIELSVAFFAGAVVGGLIVRAIAPQTIVGKALASADTAIANEANTVVQDVAKKL